MTTKWKVLTSVMTILLGFCSCFTIVFIQHSNEDLEQFIALSAQGIQGIANTVQQQTSNHYQKRIKSFLNYHASPARNAIMQAFDKRDREALLKATTPFLQLFQKENPYFSTFSWILPDNTSFLLVHNPEKYGLDVSKMRPDIVSANKDKVQYAGFSASPIGLQYRVINPVIYEGKHIGTLQFGLQDSCFLDAIHEKLDIPVGLVIPEEYAKYITKSKLPTIVGPEYTIQSRQIELFQNANNSIDWSLKRQRHTVNGKEYIILKVVQLNDHLGHPVGHIFTTLDITHLVTATKSDTLFIIILSGVLILVSFLILYSSYSALTRRIMDLSIVEGVNRQLEARVTERTQTLKERESYLKAIFNAPNEAIFIHDAQTGKILEVNQAMLDMFETSVDEVLSLTPNELSLNKPPYSEKEAMEKMRLAAAGQPQTFEWLARKRNGELFWVEVGLKRAMIQNQSLVIAVVRNIKAKKKAEKQLKLFKTFAEASNQGMGWVDIHGKLHYANATLLQILGEKELDFPLGKDIKTYYLPEERIRLWNLILPLVISKGEWSGELQIQQRDGTIIPTYNSLFLIHNENNEPQFIGNIITDISREKASAVEKEQLTEKLHQAKKMESIGLMAGGVAHDLNNILSGIVSYPELLLNKLPQESELRQPIEAIHESGQRAAVIVADLLTVARGVASIKQKNDLHSLVQEYLSSPEGRKLQAHYPDIHIRTLFNAERATISCSSVHIKKCIMNLVTNASECSSARALKPFCTRFETKNAALLGDV